jgi:CheY-like chemotaxis protein
MEGPTPKDILLVEDKPADIYLVQRAVADCGPALRLWTVPHGGNALRALHKEIAVAVPPPALVLLDLRLPECDGHDILKELRSLPE